MQIMIQGAENPDFTKGYGKLWKGRLPGYVPKQQPRGFFKPLPRFTPESEAKFKKECVLELPEEEIFGIPAGLLSSKLPAVRGILSERFLRALYYGSRKSDTLFAGEKLISYTYEPLAYQPAIDLLPTPPPEHPAIWCLVKTASGLHGCWLESSAAHRLADVGVASITLPVLANRPIKGPTHTSERRQVIDDHLTDPLIWSRVGFVSVRDKGGKWTHVGRHSGPMTVSKGWILPGKFEDKKLKANLAPGTRLYAAPVPPVPVVRGGGPRERTGILEPPGRGWPLSDLSNPIPKGQCDPYIHYKVAWSKKSGKYNDDFFGYTFEEIGDDYEESEWTTRDSDATEDFDYGRVIPNLEGTFMGEASLSQIEVGSPAITRDNEVTRHYCAIQKTELAGRVLRTEHYARTVWWINQKNPADRRWYCLKCVKQENQDYFPSRWTKDDILIIKAIGRIGKKSDYKLEVHYREPNDRRLYMQITYYLQERYAILRQVKRGRRSYFHDEPARDKEYLRTCVLTALAAIKTTNRANGNRKGGRPPGVGAKSIAKWCRQHFRINISFSEWKIRKLMIDLKL